MGELLEIARDRVVESGYVFTKGKSRSMKYCNPETPTRPRKKISAQMRHFRMQSLDERIANLIEQLKFKEKRRQQAETVQNYKLCDEI